MNTFHIPIMMPIYLTLMWEEMGCCHHACSVPCPFVKRRAMSLWFYCQECKGLCKSYVPLPNVQGCAELALTCSITQQCDYRAKQPGHPTINQNHPAYWPRAALCKPSGWWGKFPPPFEFDKCCHWYSNGMFCHSRLASNWWIYGLEWTHCARGQTSWDLYLWADQALSHIM